MYLCIYCLFGKVFSGIGNCESKYYARAQALALDSKIRTSRILPNVFPYDFFRLGAYDG